MIAPDVFFILVICFTLIQAMLLRTIVHMKKLGTTYQR